MGDDPTQEGKRVDPLDAWRGVRDIYMDAWAKNMVEMVNTEAYAQATGAMLDTYLTASTPFREALEKAMVKTLEQLAMPTRADVVSIAERMTNIEMRLDDLDAKLDTIHRLIARTGAGPLPQSRKMPQPAKKTVTAKKAKRGKK
ncbi:MAG: hypothetical protein WAL85_19825 [Candidatus Korobacteraceae bacterium]